MNDESLHIELVVSPPFMENTWIIRKSGGDQCLVIDPGFTPEKVVELIEFQKLTPAAILLTHGHVDHIAGNFDLRAKWPKLPIVIGVGDAPMLLDPSANLSLKWGMPLTSPPADQLLREGDTLDLAGISLEVLEIPGHSPGHVVYVWRTGATTRVFGGDVLFLGSIGRCDLPGGNQRLLVDGIRRKLFVLPDDAIVFPGHGEPTTIGEERDTNPYCGDRG